MNVELTRNEKNKSSVEFIQADNPANTGEMWQFTYIDKLVLFCLNRGTFVFSQGLDASLIKLKLKEILNIYPHLSGRIAKNEGIRLTNEGIRFIEEDDLSLSCDDIKNMDNPSTYFAEKLKAGRVNKGLEPIMSVKITKIKDASVLSVQCSHSALDGESFYRMVYNLGKLCQGKDINMPVVDQSLYPVRENLSKKETKERALQSGWKEISLLSARKIILPAIMGRFNKRSKAFYFSPEALHKLKTELYASTGQRISTFVALSSIVTYLLIKLCRHKNDAVINQLSILNMRERHESFPAEFVGNPLTFIATDDFTSESSVRDIAKYIAGSLEPYRKKPSEKLKDHFSLSLNTAHYYKGFISNYNFIENGMTNKPKVISCNSFAKYHIYDINFGTGTPSMVLPLYPLGPVIMWPAHPAKGGLEVYFSFRFGELINKLSEDDPWLREIQKYGN